MSTDRVLAMLTDVVESLSSQYLQLAREHGILIDKYKALVEGRPRTKDDVIMED